MALARFDRLRAANGQAQFAGHPSQEPARIFIPPLEWVATEHQTGLCGHAIGPGGGNCGHRNRGCQKGLLKSSWQLFGPSKVRLEGSTWPPDRIFRGRLRGGFRARAAGTAGCFRGFCRPPAPPAGRLRDVGWPENRGGQGRLLGPSSPFGQSRSDAPAQSASRLDSLRRVNPARSSNDWPNRLSSCSSCGGVPTAPSADGS